MPLKTVADEPPSINMIPMIDILFNLIIFFLVGTTFITSERDIALRVPEVADQKGSLSSAPEFRVVNVYRDGTITLDETAVSLDEMTQRLTQARSQYSDLGVQVRGDGRGTFQQVAEVLNGCKQAGIQELAISVRLISSGN
jgi:biopolymer transport protein ExbD